MASSSPYARSAWSIGPFSASPVLVAGLRIAGVTLAELRAETPFGTGTVQVAPRGKLGPRLMAAFPVGTSISRSGASFDVAWPVHPGTLAYPYCEADTLPFIDIPDLYLPDTILHALPGRRLSCLMQSSFLALRQVDPIIDSARCRQMYGTTYCELTLAMERVVVDES